MHQDVTLTVPGTYAADFRAAAAVELAEEAGYILKERQKIREARRYADERTAEARAADLQNVLRMLTTDAAIFQQAGTEGTDDITIQLTDRYGCLAHVCETVARRIVGPELVSNIECGPIDRSLADKISEQLVELTWAIDAAAEVHAHHFREEES
jgi:hypothetical protein